MLSAIILLIVLFGYTDATHIKIRGAAGSARVPLSEDFRENLGWTEEVVEKCLKRHDPDLPPIRLVIFTKSESEYYQKGINVFGPIVGPGYANVTATYQVQNLSTNFEKQIVRKVICNNAKNRTSSIKCSDKVRLTHLEYLTTKPSHEMDEGVETWIDGEVANSDKEFGFVSGREETQGDEIRAPKEKYFSRVRPGYAYAIVTWKTLVYARFDVEYEYFFGGEMCISFEKPYKERMVHFWPVTMLQNCTEKIHLSQAVEIGKVISYGTETIKVDNSQVTELAGVQLKDVNLVLRIPPPWRNENVHKLE